MQQNSMESPPKADSPILSWLCPNCTYLDTSEMVLLNDDKNLANLAASSAEAAMISDCDGASCFLNAKP